jgi:hypothetical protein
VQLLRTKNFATHVTVTFSQDFGGDEVFTAKILSSDEALFNLSGNGNRHYLRILGSNSLIADHSDRAV